ncbi:MAG: hypothetical protein HZA25_01940 [Candidatus Niyogibacteria bacterium]|nr:hypothetical protein [Candidatus Niyogibacteria bacterium]
MKWLVVPPSLFTIAALTLLLTSCGGGGGNGVSTTPTKQTTEQIEVQLDSGGGIYALFYGDTNLMGVTHTVYDYKGGYYLIGSCPQNGQAIDDENNVNSQTRRLGKILEVGATITVNDNMTSPTTFCPGAPYTMKFSRPENNLLTVEIDVGPLPAEYASLSVPMDLQKSLIASFRFPGVATYEQMSGVCNNLITMSGDGASYDTLDPVCAIKGGLSTGVALSHTSYAVEACSDSLKICVKRTILEIGECREVLAYNHSGADNIEIGLGHSSPLGATFHLKEEILIYEKQ